MSSVVIMSPFAKNFLHYSYTAQPNVQCLSGWEEGKNFILVSTNICTCHSNLFILSILRGCFDTRVWNFVYGDRHVYAILYTYIHNGEYENYFCSYNCYLLIVSSQFSACFNSFHSCLVVLLLSLLIIGMWNLKIES